MLHWLFMSLFLVTLDNPHVPPRQDVVCAEHTFFRGPILHRCKTCYNSLGGLDRECKPESEWAKEAQEQRLRELNRHNEQLKRLQKGTR